MKEFFKNFISGNEKRVSALIIFALILTGLAIYSVIRFTDIQSNLKDVLIWIYGFIAGSGGVQLLDTYINKNKQSNNEENTQG